jgi:hypothetical protein
VNLAEARRLAAAMTAQFGNDKIAGARVDVHLNADAADSSLANGRHAILIGPPEVTYTTYHQAEAKWTFTLIAAGAGDLLAAWDALDQLRDTIAEDFDLDNVRPAEWARPTGGVYGAYIATATHEYDL